jgi:hypothetical protein
VKVRIKVGRANVAADMAQIIVHTRYPPHVYGLAGSGKKARQSLVRRVYLEGYRAPGGGLEAWGGFRPGVADSLSITSFTTPFDWMAR